MTLILLYTSVCFFGVFFVFFWKITATNLNFAPWSAMFYLRLVLAVRFCVCVFARVWQSAVCSTSIQPDLLFVCNEVNRGSHGRNNKSSRCSRCGICMLSGVSHRVYLSETVGLQRCHWINAQSFTVCWIVLNSQCGGTPPRRRRASHSNPGCFLVEPLDCERDRSPALVAMAQIRASHGRHHASN